MNCEECLPLLEEQLDGELDGATTACVAAHVAACAPCAASAETLAREQSFYLSHAPAAAPSRDFWTVVGARIAAEEVSKATHARGKASPNLLARLAGLFSAPRFSPALTAAAVLFAVALTAALMKYAESDGQRKITQAPTESAQNIKESDSAQSVSQVANGDEEKDRDEVDVKSTTTTAAQEQKQATVKITERSNAPRRYEAAAREQQTPDQLVREAEQKYLAAIALLARDARRTGTRLDPEESARFRRTLAEIDRAIDETRRAARRNPRDPLAAQYMLAAYARKVDVLRELNSQ